MKELYLKTLALLNTDVVPTDPIELEIFNDLKKINYADLDKKQIDQFNVRPAIDFPAVLIKIEILKSEDIGDKCQKCTARVTLRLAFSYVGSTASHAPADVLSDSLEYFDIVNAVYRKFQGYFSTGFTRFSRLQLTEETRNDGLKVVSLPFTTSFIDKSAAN
ncbi:MAG: hypothetical protein V4663_06040 [Bacteroidota bacterium]